MVHSPKNFEVRPAALDSTTSREDAVGAAGGAVGGDVGGATGGATGGTSVPPSVLAAGAAAAASSAAVETGALLGREDDTQHEFDTWDGDIPPGRTRAAVNPTDEERDSKRDFVTTRGKRVLTPDNPDFD